MKQVIKLNHKTGPVEITIEGSDENTLKYLKSRIEKLFGPVDDNKYSTEEVNDLFKSAFGDFGDIFGNTFKKDFKK